MAHKHRMMISQVYVVDSDNKLLDVETHIMCEEKDCDIDLSVEEAEEILNEALNDEHSRFNR